MNNVLFRILVYIFVFVGIQIPMLNGWILFDVAFPFHYIGLILLLPHTIALSSLLWIAFGLGLLMDVFSNTPGLHAFASVMIAYFRLQWLQYLDDTHANDFEITTTTIGVVRFSMYLFPLIFLHHFLLFTIENEGFKWLLTLSAKIFFSSVYSFVWILLVALYVAPKDRTR